MQLDEQAAFFLKTFAEDGSFDPGLSFRTALKQSGLDYSLASLERVDFMLEQIRLNFTLVAESFVEKAANRNFVHLLGFYIGTVIARASRAPLTWLTPEQLQQITPSVLPGPAGLGGSIACLISNQRLFFPLALVLERLFSADATHAIHKLAAQLVLPPADYLRFCAPNPAPALPTALLQTGDSLRLAGYVTAMAVLDLARKQSSGPSLAGVLPDGQVVLKKLSGPDMREIVHAGLQALQHNPDQTQCMVFVYDASIKLADDRYPALILEVRSYFQGSTSFSLALPYRESNQDTAALKVHTLKLMETNIAADWLPSLFAHFFAGVQEHAEGAQAWQASLDESI